MSCKVGFRVFAYQEWGQGFSNGGVALPTRKLNAGFRVA